ncbi:hypothetical protein FS837_005164 [Tulasnella sp. UAMH 9824]|nr:hypothetical protein FS837_005164 [Tulasnella sp. UAMH 9824]
MLRAANQQREQTESGHEDTTALLLRIHAIPDHLLFPFSSSDPPSPAGAHLRTDAASTSTYGPKEASSQDTIRPSSFPSRQHARSHTKAAGLSEDNGGSAGDRIAIWVSLSPCRGHMNITLFEGWRIVVQVPVRDWEDKVYNADDVKRAAMICMGRQLMGEKIICVPIDIKWDFESGEADEDVTSNIYEGERRRSLTQIEGYEDSSFRPSMDSSNSRSQAAIHTRRPSAPEPYTPDASTAENGHSPLEPRLQSSSSASLATPSGQLTATPAAVSSSWSDSLGNTDSIQDYVTAPDHEDADQDVVHRKNASERSSSPLASSDFLDSLLLAEDEN